MRKLHKIYQKSQTTDNLNLLIGANVLLFIIAQILIAFKLFRLSWVALPENIAEFSTGWWKLFTYGFFHQGFIALFFNMLLLFYFGRILLDFSSQKKIIQLYFSGIITGGIFFLLSAYFFPHMYIIKNPILGASAGVMAIMTYTALRLPHYMIKIRFLGYFKLIHLLIFFIAFNLLQIPLGNPGGYFAHLGGLTVGFLFFLGEKYNVQQKKSPYNIKSENKQRKKERINQILDKISQSGYESLTQAEKEELFKQSQK